MLDRRLRQRRPETRHLLEGQLGPATVPWLHRHRLVEQRVLERRRVRKRRPRRGLLRFLLRSPAAATERRRVEPHLHLVRSGVVGPVHRQDRVLRHPPPALEELLQLGFRIARQRIGAFEQRLEQPLQHLQRPFHAAAQVHRGDHGLKRISQQCRLFPASGFFFTAT